MKKEAYHVEGATIVGTFGAVLYDCLEDMPVPTRIRLAELHSKRPMLDWEVARKALEREGYKLKLDFVN